MKETDMQSRNTCFGELVISKNGKSIGITNTPFFIGSLNGGICQCIIDDVLVNSIHAKIDYNKYGFFIMDLGTENGTFVNGHRIDSGADVSIRNGDVINIGNVKLVFRTCDELLGSKEYKQINDLYRNLLISKKEGKNQETYLNALTNLLEKKIETVISISESQKRDDSAWKVIGSEEKEIPRESGRQDIEIFPQVVDSHSIEKESNAKSHSDFLENRIIPDEAVFSSKTSIYNGNKPNQRIDDINATSQKIPFYSTRSNLNMNRSEDIIHAYACLLASLRPEVQADIKVNHLPYSIGISNQCDYRLNVDGVSPVQAVINHAFGGGYVIKDIGRYSETSMDGKTLESGKDYILTLGARINIQNIEYIVKKV